MTSHLNTRTLHPKILREQTMDVIYECCETPKCSIPKISLTRGTQSEGLRMKPVSNAQHGDDSSGRCTISRPKSSRPKNASMMLMRRPARRRTREGDVSRRSVRNERSAERWKNVSRGKARVPGRYSTD